MAFFDRVKGFLGKVFGTEESQYPEPPPIIPPREPPQPPREFDYDDDERFRQKFIDVTDNRSLGTYSEWFDLWFETGITMTEDDPREQERLFGEFLYAFYYNSDYPLSVPRDEYYDDSGLGPDRIDWERFREIKRT